MSTADVAAMPVGTVTRCDDGFGRVFVAHKVKEARGTSPAMWLNTRYRAPMDDFMVAQSSPVVIGMASA